MKRFQRIVLLLVASTIILLVVKHLSLIDSDYFYAEKLRNGYGFSMPNMPPVVQQLGGIFQQPHISALSAKTVLYQSHPHHSMPPSVRSNLTEYMTYLANTQSCEGKPVFITVARLRTELYWQMVENFYYTMAKFNHGDCIVMICVTDHECSRRCESERLPYFNYTHIDTTAHVMEQVAEIKLRYVKEALEQGVNILLLDLDVGFLRDPLLLYEGFLGDKYEHVRAQMDYTDYKNKTSSTQYNAPRPNFGVYLIKSHPIAIKAFGRAYKEYKKARPEKKEQVATDQNAMISAIKWARWLHDFNFSYYHAGWMLDIYPRPILPQTVLKLDMMYKLNPENHFRAELGGNLAREEVHTAIAVHATCYEENSKLRGLKASNAFWNSDYYSAEKRTLSKPLMFLSKRQLLDEIRTLVHLAKATRRSLIIPNVLIGVGADIGGGLAREQCAAMHWEPAYCKAIRYPNWFAEHNHTHAPAYRGERYWPGWRVLFNRYEGFEVLEPGFYHRVATDYGVQPPPPSTVSIDTAVAGEATVELGGSRLISSIIHELHVNDRVPRLVLDVRNSATSRVVSVDPVPQDILAWADSSVSGWGEKVPKYAYVPLPALDANTFPQVHEDSFRLCHTFMYPVQGNRSCFNKCK
jgi:hypothetical protein